MKRIVLLICLIIVASAFKGAEKYRVLRNQSFHKGEVLEYRVHYGFINAGEAVIEINPNIHTFNKRPCYKIDVTGRSTGTFDLFLRIRNNWGSFVDTAAFIPHQTYRNIEEGRYRKKEVTSFDYQKNIAVVKDVNNKKEPKNVSIPVNVQDLVGGYYYLRLIDYSKMDVGDTIKVNAIFENELYDFEIKYMGKEKIDTKFGAINTLVLTPIMPANKLFDGENAISVYLSDDKNKIPLKIRANMMVGAVELDIKKIKGTKHPIKFS
jgi:hypothetical protein